MEDKIVWKGYEFDFKEKTVDWFWAVVIIVIAIAAISLIYSNYLFALFIVLAGITMLKMAHKEPRYLRYEINTKGIIIDEVLFPYTSLKSFWVEDSKFAPPKLLLKSTKFMLPIIIIGIETDIVNSDAIRNYLLDFLPEERIYEPFSQKLMEVLGF